jgi:hypothetical protein
MVLTARDRRIVTAVAEFGLLSRHQIARHLRFGSVTRANAVLLRLMRNRYLVRRIQPTLNGSRRQLYILGPLGVELMAPTGDRVNRRRWKEASDLFAEHQLLVNDVRLEFEHARVDGYRLLRWLTEHELRSRNLGIIPDGYAEYELAGKTFACFIEVDNGTETLVRIQQKAAAYLDLALSGRFESRFDRRFFRALMILPSAGRRKTVQLEVARRTDRLFWFTTFEALATAGPFGPIWQRPGQDAPQSLIQ